MSQNNGFGVCMEEDKSCSSENVDGLNRKT